MAQMSESLVLRDARRVVVKVGSSLSPMKAVGSMKPPLASGAASWRCWCAVGVKSSWSPAGRLPRA